MDGIIRAGIHTLSATNTFLSNHIQANSIHHPYAVHRAGFDTFLIASISLIADYRYVVLNSPLNNSYSRFMEIQNILMMKGTSHLAKSATSAVLKIGNNCFAHQTPSCTELSLSIKSFSMVSSVSKLEEWYATPISKLRKLELECL